MRYAKLTFALPEDQVEFRMACNAYKYHDVLVALRNAFRCHRKYGASPVTEELFNEYLLDDNITLNDEE
jgi:hypothetical protein